MALYETAWHVFMPLVLLFLWHRGQREPLYRQHWNERWGQTKTTLVNPIWVHSASLGELRGAAPLVQGLLDVGYPIMLTTLTPAGRTAAGVLFQQAIHSGMLQVAYVPFEWRSAVHKFIRHVRPRMVMMTEIDTWPVLLKTVQQQGIPLCIANAQYPKQSLARDLAWGGFRSALFQAYDLVLCKSETHAQRFRSVGCQQVVVVGETRFDLPIPPAQLEAAQTLLNAWGLRSDATTARSVVCFTSAVVGEDASFVQAIRLLQSGLKDAHQPKPLVVYVPRSPQRFDEVAVLLQAAGLRLVRRSQVLNEQLQAHDPLLAMTDVDVLLGDSLGEMFFYLSLSQLVVVGGSFVPTGGHNIIEPLALKKPVMVGPSMWGIEYPGVEALACGVLQQHMTVPSLAAAMLELLSNPQAYAQAMAGAESFYQEHAGSTPKHLAMLLPWLEATAA
jgi:3-deoxy-D-manno-octulosonic-acid transferase